MSDTAAQACYEQFAELHRGPDTFIMPNVWDGPSALLFKEAGFKSIATSSATLAAMLGRIDGIHAVSRDEHLDHAVLLASVSGLPINGDFEDGYGKTPEDVRATVDAAIARGLAGIGIEDTTGDPSNPIRDFDDAVRRIEAAASAAHGQIVLTGRTDNLLWGVSDIDDTIRRLTAYAEAGADVLYAPSLPDMASIRAVVRAVAPKPVNILVDPAEGSPPTLTELQAIGVRRISLGVAGYTHALGATREAAVKLAKGDLAATASNLNFGHIIELIQG
ncbi:Carboxyvinyl-carboxyphosphonate phosphorylmutase [Streptomyces sp. MBT84]|uniref:isocitrate lyase/PEP mutase family protein n=1 Tax=unclassified Streptomyces TaxID=2593676 RepID=UPI000740D26E|nr:MULTISPECIES: isocitrate lyase/phosphoenolpyruvate mutase family protein [unclassified Streptomyces]KUJ58406.1 2-methylisocitrate lyase [Streptomyces sp. NRRL F-5122]MBW8707023.1 Carboxyvinyl-carboxyphosphonate phosphorylmutase [Streptomyces sp. MBT84]